MTVGEAQERHRNGECGGAAACTICADPQASALIPAGAGVPNSATLIRRLERVRAIWDTARSLAQELEAQLCEELWGIRQEIGPDERRFKGLIAGNSDLDPERAWLMAETWDAARRNRSLRELAQKRPSEAMTMVGEFVSSGLKNRLEALDDDDQEVVAIIAQPPRKRGKAIKALLEASRAAGDGHSPAAREEIATLTAERDAAVEQLEQARKETRLPGEYQRQTIGDLREIEARLADASADAMRILTTARPETQAEAAQVVDQIIAIAERLSEALLAD